MKRRLAIFREVVLPYSETFIPAQARALRGYDPTLIGLRRWPGSPDPGIPSQALVDELGGTREQLARLKLLGQAPRHWVAPLRARGFELLHIHFGPDALSALPLARALGLPTVLTFHGYDVYQTQRPLSKTYRLYEFRRHAILRQATEVIAVSDYLRRGLLDLGCPPGKVRTHYIGIDLARFVPVPREREPIVLSVGRLIARKGVLDLLRAWPEVRRRVPRARLVVVGSGPLEEQMRAEAARLGVGAEFVGVQTPEQVRDLMGRASVFALPSLFEAFGMVYAEAQAMRLPVVAYHEGGVPEAVEHGVSGLLTPAGDLAALSASLVRLLEDPGLRDRMGQAGRERAERKFDLERQTRQLEGIYDDALRRRAGRERPGARLRFRGGA